MSKTEILKKAIEKYGDLQLLVAMEECSELIKAITKYIRSKGDMVKEINAICDIAEEIADVQIMIKQLIMMFDLNYQVEFQKENKIKRLEKRLNDE